MLKSIFPLTKISMLKKTLTLPALVAAMALSSHAELEFEKIPLTITDASGHFFAPLTVEGKETKFLVDSGAGTVAILSTSFAQSLELPLKDIEGGSALGGAIQMHTTDVSAFKVGAFPRLKLSGLQVTDLSKATVVINGESIPPEGLIGVQFLQMSRAVFDPSAKVLMIPPHGTAEKAYLETIAPESSLILPLLKGGMSMPFIDVEVQGKVLTFLIDTGAGGNSLLPEFADELGLEVLSEGGSLGGAGEKKVHNVKYVVSQKTILGGRVDLGKTYFLVHSIGAKVVLPADKTFAGIIGTKTLGSLRSFLDFGSYSLIIPKADNLMPKK